MYQPQFVCFHFATPDIIALTGIKEMMVSQRGQPDYSGIMVAGIVLAILIIILIVFWRSDFGRFYFYLFQFLLQR